MSIADRMFARCGEPISLATRVDTPNAAGGITETYAPFATGVQAKVVPLGSLHPGPTGTEQIEEGITHVIFILDQPGADDAEYVLYGNHRLRVERMRTIGPPDIRFRQLLCEEIEQT